MPHQISHMYRVQDLGPLIELSQDPRDWPHGSSMCMFFRQNGSWRTLGAVKVDEPATIELPIRRLQIIMRAVGWSSRGNHASTTYDVHPLCVRPYSARVLTQHPRCRAEPSGAGSNGADDERFAALEQSARARGKRKGNSSVDTATQPQAESTSAGRKPERKEGQLLPSGWDDMSTGDKAVQLWMGERGLLFWANKASYAMLFIIGGGWVVFRFLGPALGLYDLANGPPQQ
jgi:hypothetical protein